MEGSGGGMRIAVCGDDRAVRQELSHLIRKQAKDADILAYQSGKGMARAGQEFGISFLDIKMGDVSGMELARRIREQERRAGHRSIII